MMCVCTPTPQTKHKKHIYYQLWPFTGNCNGCGYDLGKRPDQGFAEKKPKQDQLMKHIFGDVKVEYYYPGGS